MKLRHPALLRAAGFCGAMFIRHWMSTLDHRIYFHDPSVDPANPEKHEPMIYIIWHEYLLAPLDVRTNCDMALLIGRHADADVLSYAIRLLGFDAVRGSSSRGGSSALRELIDAGRGCNLVITPDGPRGPRRQLAQGPVYLSSRLGIPIVCCTFGYDRPFRARSWDRFAVPRLFSRQRTIVGPPLRIPAGLDRAGIEHYRRHVERVMTRLTAEAEAWATSGRRLPGDSVAFRRCRPLRSARDRLALFVGGPHRSEAPTKTPRPSLQSEASTGRRETAGPGAALRASA
ncbi:MAG: DUF374 domain-containing protein [Planctomycetales bacterium]|nr:DUF374 domain-containing protein [Planctomycetales bacterium]